MTERFEDLKNFFISRPATELPYFESYIDYKSLFRDILVPENQENLPKPLDEINAYRQKFNNDERTFRKLGFDADNLGVDIKEYIDYDLFTREYIDINDISDLDVSQILNEVNPNMFEEIEASLKDIPQFFSTNSIRRTNEEELPDIDDLEYYDDEEIDYDPGFDLDDDR